MQTKGKSAHHSGDIWGLRATSVRLYFTWISGRYSEKDDTLLDWHSSQDEHIEQTLLMEDEKKIKTSVNALKQGKRKPRLSTDMGDGQSR